MVRQGWTVPPNSITAPPGAGPSDPRFVLNADPIPDAITAFFVDGETATPVQVNLWYGGTDNYLFEALCVLDPSGDYAIVVGGVAGNNDVGVEYTMRWRDVPPFGTITNTRYNSRNVYASAAGVIEISGGALEIFPEGWFYDYGHEGLPTSMPRAYRLAYINSSLGPVSSTGAEVSIASTQEGEFDTGRVYLFEMTVQVDSSAAAAAVCSGQVRARVGAGGLGGTTMLQLGVSADQGGTNITCHGQAFWECTSDQSIDFELTLQGGTAGNPLRVVNSGNQGPIAFTVRDVGRADEDPWILNTLPTF
jgi:hypothetical protein